MATLIVAVSVATTLIVVSPVQLQPNAAPWWGIPIFTLAGGLAGAVVSGLFSATNERKRAEQEDAVATTKYKRQVAVATTTYEREVCNRYLVEVDKAWLDSHTKKDPVISDDARRALRSLELTLSDTELVLKGYHLMQAVSVVVNNRQIQTDVFLLSSARLFYRRLRGQFVNEVRSRFNLEAVSVDEGLANYPPGMHEELFGKTETQVFDGTVEIPRPISPELLNSPTAE